MTVKEKQELVRLLQLYMLEMVTANKSNIPGSKAQYEHARILSTKLSCTVNKELKSLWEMEYE